MKNSVSVLKSVLVLFVVVISLSIFVLLFCPSNVTAGSSFYFGGDSRGNIDVSVRYQQNHRVIRSETIILGGDRHRYYKPRYQRLRRTHRNPYGRVHRQQGRVYHQNDCGRIVIVVPSGRRQNFGYRY